MRPLTQFLVKIDQKFKDTFTLGGKELYLDSKFDEFSHRTNFAPLVAVPARFDWEVQEGDILYFHHHVVMEKMYDVGEGQYLVNYDPAGGYSCHAIAIERDGELTMLGDWCFVSVEEGEENVSPSGIILSLEKEEKLEGKLLSLPSKYEWLGAEVGDTIGYTKDADYKMETTSGEDVYRMRTTELVYAKKD